MSKAKVFEAYQSQLPQNVSLKEKFKSCPLSKSRREGVVERTLLRDLTGTDASRSTALLDTCLTTTCVCAGRLEGDRCAAEEDSSVKKKTSRQRTEWETCAGADAHLVASTSASPSSVSSPPARARHPSSAPRRARDA